MEGNGNKVTYMEIDSPLLNASTFVFLRSVAAASQSSSENNYYIMACIKGHCNVPKRGGDIFFSVTVRLAKSRGLPPAGAHCVSHIAGLLNQPGGVNQRSVKSDYMSVPMHICARRAQELFALPIPQSLSYISFVSTTMQDSGRQPIYNFALAASCWTSPIIIVLAARNRPS